jgi:hypothetical protein
MKPLRAVTALLATAAALAACGDGTTSPTDADLVGTWTITPATSALPGGGAREMTVSFGPGGAYALEAATYGGLASKPLAYEKSVGSVTAADGQLWFHPSGAMSFDRHDAAAPYAPTLDPGTWDPSHPLSYQVVGNQLVLHLSPSSTDPVLVLTRRK